MPSYCHGFDGGFGFKLTKQTAGIKDPSKPLLHPKFAEKFKNYWTKQNVNDPLKKN